MSRKIIAWLFRTERSNTALVELCIHASYLAKMCLTDSIEGINIQNIVEFTCQSATGNLPSQTIASFSQSFLAFTRTKLSTAATKSLAVSSRPSRAVLVSDSTVSPGLECRAVISLPLSKALHRTYVSLFVVSILRNLASHSKGNQGLRRIFRGGVAGGTFFVMAPLSSHHEEVPTRIGVLRCEAWRCWGSTDHQHRFSGIPCPQELDAAVVLAGSATKNFRLSPSLAKMHYVCQSEHMHHGFGTSKLIHTAPVPCRTDSLVYFPMLFVRHLGLGND